MSPLLPVFVPLVVDDVRAVDVIDPGDGHEICLARVCPSVACCDFHVVNLPCNARERNIFF